MIHGCMKSIPAATPITLTKEEHAELEGLARSTKTEHRLRRRARLLLFLAAGQGGGNFLTPEIAHTARRETAYREIGAMIDAERLATNLLSSMPLTFNLLAPWGHALERASGYLRELLPTFTGSARQLLFEHSPGRGNPKFTADYTAFAASHARLLSCGTFIAPYCCWFSGFAVPPGCPVAARA